MAFDAQSLLKSMTQRPGIYQMMDADGAVLYVGKAKNLKNRVSSYFRKSGLSPKTAALVKRIAQVDVTVTETETEALILEHNLIKQYRPPFNILMRDDKSYPYIFMSDEKWPRLAFHRGPKKAKGQYFGPFPSVHAVRESMGFLQKTFKVRQCEDVFFKNRSRPCLQYQIKRCTAPCVDLVDTDEYAADVEKTRLYLEGKADKILKHLEVEMENASAELDFEKAAEHRDQISALRQIQSQQVIEKGNGVIDVVAAAVIDGMVCVHILYIRQGRILGSRSYYPKSRLVNSPDELLSDFLPLLYLDGGSGPDLPKEIVGRVPIRFNRNNSYVNEKIKVMPKHGFTSMFNNMLKNKKVIITLGKIAFDACIKFFKENYGVTGSFKFGHDVKYKMNDIVLLGCYHPSPRNVNTKRIDIPKMVSLFKKAKKLG